MNLKGLKFSKMHGIGNDFVIIDESKGEIINLCSGISKKNQYCKIFSSENEYSV